MPTPTSQTDTTQLHHHNNGCCRPLDGDCLNSVVKILIDKINDQEQHIKRLQAEIIEQERLFIENFSFIRLHETALVYFGKKDWKNYLEEIHNQFGRKVRETIEYNCNYLVHAPIEESARAAIRNALYKGMW